MKERESERGRKRESKKKREQKIERERKRTGQRERGERGSEGWREEREKRKCSLPAVLSSLSAADKALWSLRGMIRDSSPT